MTDTTGNFNDLVQLSGDTLYDLGEAFVIGNSLATTIYQSFSNSAGILQIGASHSNNETIWFPNGSGSLSSGGTILTNILVSAGTTSFYQSAVTLSNVGNVSFGFNGASAITASAGAAQGSINFSAGTTSNNLSAVTFSNSNNVSFGLNGSTITANAPIVFVDPALGSRSLTQIEFSSSYNVIFGLSGGPGSSGTITAYAPILISAGANQLESTNFAFANSNGVSWGYTGGSISASIATSLSNINVSAGTTSNNLSAVTFSNLNNVSFGLNGSTITANAGMEISVPGFEQFATQLTFSNNAAITFGLTTNVAGGAVITATIVQPSIALSAGTGIGYSSEFVFSNSNNISFGIQNANSVITASYNFNISAGTTSNNLNAVTFSNSNGISFGLNGSVITASQKYGVIVAGTQSFIGSGTLSFANSNGFSFGMSNSSVITLDYGGFSSWSNGQIVSSFGSSNGFLSLNPIVVDYAITATNAIWLANFSGLTNSSGVISFSLGVYTLAGGTTGTLNLASSSTSAYTWTSGAAFSSQTGVGYRQMSLNSWVFTPGLYVFAFNAQTTNSASMSLYGIYQLNTIVALANQLTNLVFPGLTQASTAGLPAAISVSNTSGYIRSGSSAFQQPWLLFQGT